MVCRRCPEDHFTRNAGIPRNGSGSRGRKIDRERLAQLVQEQPDATLVEPRDRLGVDVTPWAISKALRELKLTYKKSRSMRPSKTVAMSPKLARPGV